ncbi:uncharacterized protein LOC132718470 [Ruditapes philippinarum]|uniref:uncharacterized protein LOC132718470 n=1 Tax=Ruditapes philippinarum TaxID=129788 RepID=UPI00295C2695|nr:uncharacterized protein LOC132718470 [Ruditapes philippinarum]
METLKSATEAMRKDCFFGSVDLSEAFYSISVRPQDRKFFRFIHKGQKYQFTCLVMGLTTSPRVFTKLLKPVYATLRSQGFISTAYIDDSCLQGQTYEACLENIEKTVTLMDSLGLTIHLEKSVLVPTKQINFLGFLLCSETMTIRLTLERKSTLIELCKNIINKRKCLIRHFAQLIGKLVASEPGVEYAPLFYIPLEKVKDKNLRLNKGQYDKFMKLSSKTKNCINWWIVHTPINYKLVLREEPSLTICSDASLSGWGAIDITNCVKTGGQWSGDEQRLHINVLELKACELAIQSLCKHISNTHVRIYMDNTTSCSYINKFGGKSENLDLIARSIWIWCIDRKIHLSAAHLPGSMNCEADEMSRKFNDDLEWSLTETVFSKIFNTYRHIDIDLFASRLNKKLSKYVTRLPDPDAHAIDAFSLTWKNMLYYIFPPFSLLSKVLQKIEINGTEAVIVVPVWTTQVWWPSLLRLISGPCYILPSPQKILHLHHKPERKHPLTKMKLAVFRLSGNPLKAEEYQLQLPTSLSNLGEKLQRNSTIVILNSGFGSVGKREILLSPL